MEFFELLSFICGLADVLSTLMYFSETDVEGNYTRLQCLGLFFLGLFIGGISLIIFTKPMMFSSSIRIFAAIITPVLAGLIAKCIAEYVSRRKDDVWPMRHFWYAFNIAFGCILVRLMASASINNM